MGSKNFILAGATVLGIAAIGTLYTQAKHAYKQYQKSRLEWVSPEGNHHYGNPDTETTSMVMMGDSIGAGFGAKDIKNTIAHVLAREIASSTNTYVSVNNISKVGACSRELMDQIRQMDTTPDVVFISIGANDVLHSESIASSLKSLGEVVRLLNRRGAKVFVLTCPDLGALHFIPQPLRYILKYIADRYGVLQSSATLRAGGRPISVSKSVSPRFVADPEMFGPDMFHPSEKGYVLAATAMIPFILPHLAKEKIDGGV